MLQLTDAAVPDDAHDLLVQGARRPSVGELHLVREAALPLPRVPAVLVYISDLVVEDDRLASGGEVLFARHNQRVVHVSQTRHVFPASKEPTMLKTCSATAGAVEPSHRATLTPRRRHSSTSI